MYLNSYYARVPYFIMQVRSGIKRSVAGAVDATHPDTFGLNFLELTSQPCAQEGLVN